MRGESSRGFWFQWKMRHSNLSCAKPYYFLRTFIHLPRNQPKDKKFLFFFRHEKWLSADLHSIQDKRLGVTTESLLVELGTMALLCLQKEVAIDQRATISVELWLRTRRIRCQGEVWISCDSCQRSQNITVGVYCHWRRNV